MNSKIPIIKIGENLIVSLKSDIDDRTAVELQSSIIDNIQKTKATGLLIEISSVDMVDSFLGRLLSDIAKTAMMMNTITIIVGIQPAVAITLVELGLQLKGIKTALDMESGIELLKNLKNKRKPSSGDNNKSDKKDIPDK